MNLFLGTRAPKLYNKNLIALIFFDLNRQIRAHLTAKRTANTIIRVIYQRVAMPLIIVLFAHFNYTAGALRQA